MKTELFGQIKSHTLAASFMNAAATGVQRRKHAGRIIPS